jgi:hypothetical protein
MEGESHKEWCGDVEVFLYLVLVTHDVIIYISYLFFSFLVGINLSLCYIMLYYSLNTQTLQGMTTAVTITNIGRNQR